MPIPSPVFLAHLMTLCSFFNDVVQFFLGTLDVGEKPTKKEAEQIIKIWKPPITVLSGRAGQRFGFGRDRPSVAIGFAAGIVSAADCAGQTAAV